MHPSLSELQSSEMTIVAYQVEIEDGVISCPDSVTIPQKDERVSILKDEPRLTGKATAMIGDTIWLSCNFTFADEYADIEKSVMFTLPAGTRLIDNGLSLNGESVAYDSSESGFLLNIKKGGVLKVGVKILPTIQVSRLNFTATLDYALDGTAFSEILGT